MAFRLEDRHLVMLAERFPKNWDLTVLGEVVLGLEHFEVDAIKTNHSGDVKQAAHELLKKWNGRQSDPGDAYHQLKTRLRSVQDFTSLATDLEQWVERGMDQPGTSMCDISDIQQTVRDYLEVELEDSLYNDWLKCDDRKALPLMYLYTDLKWTIKVEKRVGSDRWEERSSVFDILPGQQDKPMKILVEAAAGMGKTSTVSYLAMNWVQQKEKIPFDLVFQVPLRVLNQLDANTSLAEIIQSNNGLEDVPSSRVEAILRGDTKSKVLLILDGYDEYNGKITALNKVVEKNVNSFFLLIFSRPGKDPSDETYIKKAVRDKMQRQVMIEGFTDESIETCCKLFLDDNEELKEAMLKQVRQKSAMGTRGYSGLWELLRTPITLLMMCALFEEHGTLPKTRTQIYKQIRELSVERTLNKPDSPPIKNLEETLYRLGEFAWKALQEDNLLLNKSELEESDGDILRLGLLQEVGGDSMSLRKKEIFVTFQHKTMQEFVAAEYLAKHFELSSNKMAILRELLPSVYTSVFSQQQVRVFCSGLMVDPRPLIAHVEALTTPTIMRDLPENRFSSELNSEVTHSRVVPGFSTYLLSAICEESGQEVAFENFLKTALRQLSACEELPGLYSDGERLTGLLHAFTPTRAMPLTKLDLTDAGLNKSDIDHLVVIIKEKLPKLRKLSLSGNKLTGFLEELKIDTPLQGLQRLRLRHTKLNASDIQHLGALIRDMKLPTLSRLDLSENRLTSLLPDLFPPDGAPLPSLAELMLDKTELNKSDLKYLARLIRDKKLCEMEVLSLGRNNLHLVEVECGELIKACVTHHQRGLELDLLLNQLSSDFIEKWRRLCEGSKIDVSMQQP